MPSPLKILILEDNLLDAQLEISILEQAGFDCEWNRIETKLEFLNFLANPSSYDLVLADYNLPNFDGLTALKLFTKCNLDIPFIIVSGSLGEELAVESVKIGATDYVLKDRLSRLEMVVKRALLEVQDRRARVRAEQELYKLSRAVEYSPSLIMIADLEGKIEYVNPKFTQLTGYSQEEVLGQNRNILRSYSAAAGNDQAPQSLIKDEWQGEVYNKKKDGSFFWASCSIAKIKDPSGKATHILTVEEDITERKLAETVLRESETSLKQAQQIARLGNWSWDLKKNQIQWSDEMFAIYGFEVGTIPDIEKVRQLIHEDDLTYFDTALQELGPVKTPESLEYRITKPDGELRYLISKGQTFSDHDSTLARFVGTLQDITEGKLAEAALRESEEKYRTLFTNIPIPVFTKNKKGVYTSSNTENQVYWAKGPIGFTDDDLLDHQAASKLRKIDLEVMESGGPITTEEVLGSPEQGLRQLLTRKVPMWNNAGDIVGVLGASLDITERKHLEEQLRLAQKMEAVGQLTAGIAHDFNNMLTVINMSTYLIKQDLSSNDPLEEKVQRISDASKQAANLIAQLMAFSRKQILEPQILSLNVIVKQIEQMLQRTIGEHIEFETSFAPNLWLVKVDPTQIEQMVVNLAVNARDAMPDGGRLSIKLTNTVLGDNYIGQQFQLDPGDYVKLTISDTGIGMSDDIISRIFEPFFTTKEVGRGTGLGLATLYGIVKQNKGDIQVSSKIGVGTTFEIYLPQNESPDLEKPAVLQEKVALKGSETVLLVEDDDGVRELVLDVLQLYGYTVLIAKSGTEALNLFEQHGEHIGILLIDVIMPRMSGKILAQHLSQLRPDVKILYMSGYTDDVIASHGVFEPGVEFLSKPFGPKTLARKIRQVLDRS